MPGPLFLGIEIGGTKLQLGLGHGDGNILALQRRTVVPSQGAQGIQDQITEAFDALLKDVGAPREAVAAAGIGFGGPVDVDRGRVLKSHQIDGWNQFPLADWAKGQLGIAHVVLQNDADTAGLGEARFGAGQGFSPLLYVTIGSGIGGGLILDDRIYRGGGGGATEIGHLRVIDPNNPTAEPRVLEQVASGWGISSAARRLAETQVAAGRRDWRVLQTAGGTPSAITGLMVAKAAEQGDPLAATVLQNAAEAVAFALNQAITLLAPRRIILGGGVSLIGEALWFAPIRKKVDADVFPPFRGTFDIVPAALGEAVVIHGALALARDATHDR